MVGLKKSRRRRQFSAERHNNSKLTIFTAAAAARLQIKSPQKITPAASSGPIDSSALRFASCDIGRPLVF